MQRERELKLALTEAGADRLEALWGPPARIILQENHYLDTPGDLLRELRFGLRLRIESGLGCALTLKGPALLAGALSDRLEEERALDAAEAGRIRAGGITLGDLALPIPPPLAHLPRETRFVVRGMLANERRVLAGSCSAGLGDLSRRGLIRLELDRSRYPGGVLGCELEVEFAAQAVSDIPQVEQWLRALFAREGIEWLPESRSKLERFWALPAPSSG